MIGGVRPTAHAINDQPSPEYPYRRHGATFQRFSPTSPPQRTRTAAVQSFRPARSPPIGRRRRYFGGLMVYGCWLAPSTINYGPPQLRNSPHIPPQRLRPPEGRFPGGPNAQISDEERTEGEYRGAAGLFRSSALSRLRRRAASLAQVSVRWPAPHGAWPGSRIGVRC